MDSPKCFACHDLGYDRFVAGEKFLKPGYGRIGTKYKKIELADLRKGASEGCRYCSLLENGFKMAGTKSCETVLVENPGSILILESAQGRGLIAKTSTKFEGDIYVVTDQLEFYTQNRYGANIPPIFGQATTVSRHLTSHAAATFLQTQLKLCLDSNYRCGSPVKDMPKRVLELSSFPDTVRLVEFKDGHGPHESYATLSHCWGKPDGPKPLTTTTHNIESRKKGFPVQDLPVLFRDAMKLCCLVQCNYIWIDSLCIIQDDAEDWKVESAKMTDVYSNAFFNVAATSTPDSSYSLFRDRKINDPAALRWSLDGDTIWVRQSHTVDHAYLRESYLLDRSAEAPLLSRAWVLQEILLAPRVLYICSSELIWECGEMTACECGSMPPDPEEPTIPGAVSQASLSNPFFLSRKKAFQNIRQQRCSTQAIHDFWLHIIGQYSPIRLTKREDRAIALQGMVTAVQKITNGTYFMGMWKEDLLRSLLWINHLAKEHAESETTRLPNVPTWAWMSRVDPDGSCGASYVEVLGLGFEPAQDVSVVIEARGETTFELAFQGPVIAGWAFVDLDGLCKLDVNLPVYGPVDIKLWPDSPREDDLIFLKTQVKLQRVYCLLLGSGFVGSPRHHVLVVKKHKNVDGDFYTRIGRATLPKRANRYDFFSEADIEIIRLR